MDIVQTVELDIAGFTAKFLPAPIQNFFVLILTDEGQILQSVTASAVPDLLSNGLTSAGIIATAKDIFENLASQNITTFTLQHVFSYLNMVISPAPAIAATVADTAAS